MRSYRKPKKFKFPNISVEEMAIMPAKMKICVEGNFFSIRRADSSILFPQVLFYKIYGMHLKRLLFKQWKKRKEKKPTEKIYMEDVITLFARMNENYIGSYNAMSKKKIFFLSFSFFFFPFIFSFFFSFYFLGIPFSITEV